MPQSWEQRTALFCAYLVDRGLKSTTLRSYVSAIKCILKDDKYKWVDGEVVLDSLIRACKLTNDIVTPRLPISKRLLELILFEIGRLFNQQPYLEILYKTVLAIGYYGLFRIGELTVPGDHTIKASNVHVAKNKQKILLVLYILKTHGVDSYPQKVKITGTKGVQRIFFCPFTLMKQYMRICGGYEGELEPLFIFHDKQPLRDHQLRSTLKCSINRIGLDENLYDVHSLRIG